MYGRYRFFHFLAAILENGCRKPSRVISRCLHSLKYLFVVCLGLCQVCCFYDKMHNGFTYPPHYCGISAIRHRLVKRVWRLSGKVLNDML